MDEMFDSAQRPARHRLDVFDYYKVAEAGILKREDGVELIDGEIIHMNPIGSATALVAVRSPLRLDPFKQAEPDLTLPRPRADEYRASHPSAADVLLLIEV
jgi:hypothetical protein